MSKTELTGNEVIDSLSGFDEIAIEKHMGYDVYTSDEPEYGVFRSKPVLLLRCLVFVMERRRGLNDVEARKAALDMPASDVKDYFAEEPDEVDPDDPETEPGKDASVPENEHTSSPASA